MQREQGFTILELLIGIVVIMLLAGAAAVELVGFQRGSSLESAAKDIMSELRFVQNKALSGSDGDLNGQGDAWGVRFSNGSSDLYQTFWGTTYNASNVKETVYLPSNIIFTNPAESADKDVIFTKITGTTTPTTIVIGTTDGAYTHTVTVATSSVATQ